MKATLQVYLRTAIVLILAVTLGCSKPPNDTQIANDVEAKISADSGLHDKQLVVQAASGTVTLSGEVDNDAQRDAAARYAASVSGVKQVVNNLQVGASVVDSGTAMQQSRPSPNKRRRDVAKKGDEAANSPTETAQSTAPPAPEAPAAQSSPASAPSPPPPPPPPQKVTVSAGTNLAIRLVDPLDSETATQGQSFAATLNAPLAVDGNVVIPAGNDVTGHVVSVQSAGRFAGQSLLVLQLDTISVGANHYNIQTDEWKRQGSSRGKNTAEKVGAGAGIGAIIGAIAGGGKGAAIGAAAGGGLGGGVQAATKGQQITLPSETVLNFTLQAPVSVLPTTHGPGSGRQQLGTNQ